MKKEYNVIIVDNEVYAVIEKTITYGERTSAYDTEPDNIQEYIIYRGCLSDCYAFIKLKEGGYMWP